VVCVRRISQINPRTIIIKFECPSCGNTLNVLQQNQDIKEPSVCVCGRKGKFRLISRELKDYRSMRVKSPSILDDEE